MTFLGRSKVTAVVPVGPARDVRQVDALDFAENCIILALSDIDRALRTYATHRRTSDLTDGLLDVRTRLTKGLPS